MEKSADAFRTISEVAEDLVLPQHVLRFWETRFAQIRPLKRAGGRRYYRPVDVVLLRSIRRLLYDEGYTIKGVQRLLKEQGARGLRVGEHGWTAAFADEPNPIDDEAAEHADPAEDSGDGAVIAAASREPAQSLEWHGLREALASIEECERILKALRRPVG